MTNDEFWLKYRRKLCRAWLAGCTDYQAAKYAGCVYEELEDRLKESPGMREAREERIDSILVKAQQNVAQKIQDGDLKASEWYIEKMDFRFGGKKIIPEEEHEDLDGFLDDFTAKGEFDEG